MAVIWIDEFQGGKVDRLIAIGLYELQKAAPLAPDKTPEVYGQLWRELVLPRRK